VDILVFHRDIRWVIIRSILPNDGAEPVLFAENLD